MTDIEPRSAITDEMRERIANPDLDHLEEAILGNLTPLADHIQSGGTLHSQTREWLAKHLRNELPAKTGGRPRTQAKKLEDYQIWTRVVEVRGRDNAVGPWKSIEIVAAELELSPSTVQSAFKRMSLEPKAKT